MTRVPSDTSQRVFAIMSDAKRLGTALSGVTTPQALQMAEQTIRRMEDDLRALKPMVRRLKAEARGLRVVA